MANNSNKPSNQQEARMRSKNHKARKDKEDQKKKKMKKSLKMR